MKEDAEIVKNVFRNCLHDYINLLEADYYKPLGCQGRIDRCLYYMKKMLEELK